MGAATVAVGWSGYAASLLCGIGVAIPPALAAAPGTEVRLADGGTVTGIVNLPAAFIVLVLTAMLVAGTKESARLNNVMVAVKLLVVAAFIALGAAYVDPARWQPFVPANTGAFGEFGWSGVLRGAAVVFFAGSPAFPVLPGGGSGSGWTREGTMTPFESRPCPNAFCL